MHTYASLTEIIITCVSNEEDFAKGIYDYLYAELEKQTRLKEGKDLEVTRDSIRLVPDNNEIRVDSNTHVPSGMIRWILESYLKSDASRFKDYGVIEFGDTFTIGRILHPSQMEMLTCEICGFFTPYSAELYTHRMTHFGI
jgi:hypothetical protein